MSDQPTLPAGSNLNLRNAMPSQSPQPLPFPLLQSNTVAAQNTVGNHGASTSGSNTVPVVQQSSATVPVSRQTAAQQMGAQPPVSQQLSAPPANSRQAAVQSSQRVSWEGRSLGEYQIGKLLGAGGNGLVYLAVHRWLERAVAVKFLNDIQAGDAQAVERFRREAQVAAHLIHPGIVRATDGGTVGSQVFLVTDFVDGLDLTSIVHEYQRLTRDSIGLRVAEACEIGAQAAAALQFISSKGIVHRDIKPSNIMLDRGGEVRILDLGLARTQHHGHTMTATGQVMGTIDYMAPEQASDPRRVSHLADIYSLGCTLYFLLTGRPPLDTAGTESLAAKLMATLDREPPALGKFSKDIPNKLEDLIHRMMDKDPTKRPQTFAIITKELQNFASGANLPALLTSSAGQLASQRTVKTESSIDQMADWIERGMIYAVLMLGVFFGFIEADPIVRPGQRKRYSFSFKWLKPFGAILFIAFIVWMSGIRFSATPPDGEYY